jgi:hypothetical protein
MLERIIDSLPGPGDAPRGRGMWPRMTPLVGISNALCLCARALHVIDEPRDSESARTLLESRLQAAREPKIPPEGGTPTRSRATELACAQGVRKSIQRQLFISPPWPSPRWVAGPNR